MKIGSRPSPMCHPERRLRSNRVEVLRNEAKRNEAKPTRKCVLRTTEEGISERFVICRLYKETFECVGRGYEKNVTKAEQTLRKLIRDPAVRVSRLRFCSTPLCYIPQNFDFV